MCPVCKTAVGLNLSEREFTCPSCASTFDGYVASAVVMLKEGFARGTHARRPGMSMPPPSAWRNTSRVFPT
jgi:transposase